jgi:S1-C subfamily serine protease
VVQVVAVHDSELTSTYAALAFESKVRVASIVGSAFAIGPGEFVTDSGLLVGAKEVALRAAGGRSVPARVVGSDAMIGVAVLRAELPDLPVLELRDDPPVRPGEVVTALGFSDDTRAGAEPVISAGVLSGVHRGPSGIHPIEDYLQTDASLPRGLAGGPLVDARGRVAGMCTGLVFGSEIYLGYQTGIGMAIPAEWVARALAWIRSGSQPRAWIGAYAIAADADLRSLHSLPPDARLVVEQVFPGSPAAAAGLRRGDGLLRVGGDEAASLPRLHLKLLGATSGDVLTLDIARGAETRALSVTLAPRPDKPRLAGLDALRYFGGLNLGSNGDRLVVESVLPGSEAAVQKIVAGDVLLGVLSKKDWVDGAKDNSRWRSVRTVEDLEERLKTAYSDLDFCVGLRLRNKAGIRREILLWDILTPTGAL